MHYARQITCLGFSCISKTCQTYSNLTKKENLEVAKYCCAKKSWKSCVNEMSTDSRRSGERLGICQNCTSRSCKWNMWMNTRWMSKGKIKSGKAGGSSDITIEMTDAAGDRVIGCLT